ncbi:MAG: hypothetical protein QOK29_2276 [Rhodospirillaceae bacterium]|jgi:hypothetical protein|nr:hypothetical protein [Rhodospirillaceae bacterium]
MPLRPPRLDPDPETLALQALAHIVGDEELLPRFIALSGLDGSSLRARAADPAVLGGVLDFVLGDERLVTSLAVSLDLPPESFARARRKLPGATPES